MQIPLLQNILNPKADNQNSLLMGEKKIGSDEIDIFSKLLQGTVDVPKMQKMKSGFSEEIQLVKNSDDDFLIEDLKINKEDSTVNGALIQDNEGLVKILSGESDEIQSLLPNSERQDVIKIIVSNPKLIEIFAKTENIYEIIPRLKDLMIRNPEVANEVKGLLDKMKGSQSKEVFQLGRIVATGVENKIEFMPRKNVVTIANYGKAQNIINKNIIKIKNHNQTHHVAREIENKKDDNVLDFPRLDSIQPKTVMTSGEAKVFNIESLGSVKNNEQIINKISDYIQQQNFQNKKSLDLIVKHDDLGHFKLNVAKQATGDQLNIKIATATDEGRAFFINNGARLTHALESAGIKISDVKVVSIVNELGKSDFDNKNSQMDQNSNRSFSQQGQGRHEENKDSQRRRELWQQFQERNSA